MSFSEAFFALLPPLHAILRGVVVLTKGASDERVYGLSARLPDEPAHMGCRMLAHLRDGGVYRCSGRGARVQRCVRRCRRTSESFSIRRTFTGRAAAGRVLVVY